MLLYFVTILRDGRWRRLQYEEETLSFGSRWPGEDWDWEQERGFIDCTLPYHRVRTRDPVLWIMGFGVLHLPVNLDRMASFSFAALPHAQGRKLPSTSTKRSHYPSFGTRKWVHAYLWRPNIAPP